MNATDIVGYALKDGFVLCPDCFDERYDQGMPIFADESWEYCPTCDHCLELLNVRLIVKEP